MPFVPTSIAAWVMNVSDRLYVSHFNGNAELGIYAVANKFSAVESLLVSAFVLAWGPYAMAVGLSEHNERVYPTVLRYYWVGALACALGLSALSPLALPILAGPTYSSAYRAVVPLTYGLAIGGAFSIVSMGSTLGHRSYHLMIAQVGGALFHLCLNFLLIPPFGMVGAAWSTLVSQCITLGVQMALSQRTLPFPYPVKTLLVVFGVAIVFGVLCTSLQGVIGTLGLVLSTLVRLLISLFFVLMCVLFRVVPYAFWSRAGPRSADGQSVPELTGWSSSGD
jgi:O-antigen/teichoic acid export membrane protein